MGVSINNIHMFKRDPSGLAPVGNVAMIDPIRIPVQQTIHTNMFNISLNVDIRMLAQNRDTDRRGALGLLRNRNYLSISFKTEYNESFEKLYFVDDVDVKNGIATITAHVDTLNTYYDQLKGCTVFVERSAKFGNAYLNDNMSTDLVTHTKFKWNLNKSPLSVSNANGWNYVLEIAGSKF